MAQSAAPRVAQGVISKLGEFGLIRLISQRAIKGRLAEHAIGMARHLLRNNRAIPSGHIPDFLTKTTLREVKNWKVIGALTTQMRSFANYCRTTGRTYYIHVRPGTTIRPGVEAELNRIFGPGSKGRLWDIVRDIPESLGV